MLLDDLPPTFGARTPPFLNSSWYCYANSTAMLLGAAGEDVSPRLIEVLSGVGLGAFVENGLLFFSGLAGAPDEGISAALALLGFAVDEDAAEDGAETDAAAFARLEQRLRRSPVVLGPLDMQHLRYDPARPTAEGLDHYVLALAIMDDHVLLHDPAGFAYVRLSKTDLAKAWKADGVLYRRGVHRSWSAPRRVRTVDAEYLYWAAFRRFADLYRRAEIDAEGAPIDGAAILALGPRAFDAGQREHLLGFALPLGAKRALDFAAFFARRHPRLADLKLRQAGLFGAWQSSLSAEASETPPPEAIELACIEDAIRAEILAGAA